MKPTGLQYAQIIGIVTGKQGFLYLGDSINSRIHVLQPEKPPRSFSCLPLCNTSSNTPSAIAIGNEGVIHVANTFQHRIERFDSADCTTFGVAGSGDGEFNRPCGIATDGVGRIYVADTGNNRIQVFAPDGKFWGKFGTQGSAPGEFNKPLGVCVSTSGLIYVADQKNHRVQIFQPNETVTKFNFVSQLDHLECQEPSGVLVARSGLIYVLSGTDQNRRISVFTSFDK